MHWNFGWPFWGGATMFLIPIILIVIVIYAVYKLNEDKKDSLGQNKTPEAILDERYAKGELTLEEYQQIKENLRK